MKKNSAYTEKVRALFWVKLQLRTGKHEDSLSQFFTPRSWKQLWIKNACFLALLKDLCDIFQGKHDADPTVVIFSLFPCAFFLLLQTCGRCCGLCCYSMRWAASRASGVSPRVSETASPSWRWTAPSTPTPPASTSRPAWSCATGRRTSEPVPGSLCRQ